MVWITGYRGMLGSEVARQLSSAGIAFTASDLEVDITDERQVDAFFLKNRIDRVVNCAAYTAVDRAEDEEAKAFAVNAKGPENLAKCAAKYDATIIHLSTDYVFAGTDPGARKESDPTGPSGAYGRTKLAGELAVTENCPRFFIVRTAWLYGQFGANFVYTMLKLMSAKDEIRVVNDQQGSPTFADDLAAFIRTIITSNSTGYGIYHFSNEGEITWFEFAQKIYETARAMGILQKECRVIPCSSAEYAAKAVRPAYSLLDKTKAKKSFSFEVPHWQSSLEIFLRNISFPIRLTRM